MKKRFLKNSLNAQEKIEISELAEQRKDKSYAGEYFLNLYEQIIQNSRDVLYCINYTEFEIIYISPSVVEITGYSIEELMQMSNKDLLNLIHPVDQEGFLKHFRSLDSNTGRKNQSFEYRLKPKRGISRWVDDNHILIYDPKDNKQKIIGNIHDITELKLVEDALKRSRDRLYMGIEATNDGMWDWWLDTNKIYFDVRFYTMMGYEPHEFPGSLDEWMNRIHPDDLPKVKEQLNRYLKENSGQWCIEYRFLAKDNRWIWVLNRGKVFDRDDMDKPLRMVGTHSDISVQKAAELALNQKNQELIVAEERVNTINQALLKLNEDLNQQNKELAHIFNQLQISEERFRQLAENTEDVFWLRDESHILYINPAFEKIWGHTKEEILDHPELLMHWIHPDDLQIYNSWITFAAFEDQSSYAEQYRIIKPDGEIRWLWARMFPIYNDEKNIYRIAGIASDITELKKTEEELIAAKEKALESDRLKSAFLANISHEIRTPMNGIIGFTQLLKERAKDVETREQFIDIIVQSSTRLLNIVEDIVYISKIESNQLRLKKENIDLKLLLEEIYHEVKKEQQILFKDHIEFFIDLEDLNVNPVIYTDPERLKHVLIKLISNAFKFTEKGCVKLGYRFLEKDTLEFYIQDTGIGIPVKYQEQLFKRFQQVDASNSRKFGGIGLGLAICEGIVKLFGGRIWIKSEPSKGTTVYFTVPSVKSGISVQAVSETKPDEKLYRWPDKTVLIVEDDLINKEYFKAILDPSGIHMIFAISGEEAVRICRENSNIHLVLMDIRLPAMTGYEAFQQIRQINPKLPVIAQSAFAMPEDTLQYLHTGFSDFIAKPINRNVLFAMIKKYMV